MKEDMLAAAGDRIDQRDGMVVEWWEATGLVVDGMRGCGCGNAYSELRVLGVGCEIGGSRVASFHGGNVAHLAPAAFYTREQCVHRSLQCHAHWVIAMLQAERGLHVHSPPHWPYDCVECEQSIAQCGRRGRYSRSSVQA